MPDIYLMRRSHTKEASGESALSDDGVGKANTAARYLRYALLGAPLVVYASKHLADRWTAHAAQRALRPDDPLYRTLFVDERLNEPAADAEPSAFQQFGRNVYDVLLRVGRMTEHESYSRSHEFQRPGINMLPAGMIVAGETAIRSLVTHIRELRGHSPHTDADIVIPAASLTKISVLDTTAKVDYVGQDVQQHRHA